MKIPTPLEAKEWSWTNENERQSKQGWPEGQWMHEPDKKQWTDEATGLPCLILRNGHGALCGYVGVPEGHSWFEVEYHNEDPCPESIIDVHGGLTFSSASAKNEMPGLWVCCEPKDADLWWFGFDCSHLHDFAPGFESLRHGCYRTIEYVTAEVTSLAKQLAAIDLGVMS